MSLGTPFSPESPQAEAIASLFGYVLVLAAVIFATVAGLVTYAIVRYRARLGAIEPRKHFGSRRLEIIWTSIPVAIVTVLFILTIRTMAFVDAPEHPAQAPDVVITGHQWWWEARYPNGAVVANEVHIPASRRLLARIESVDVIHDFWVPQLERKMDAVPGVPSYIWLQADKAGTYQGECSEFCGMQHAWMRLLVVSEPEADYSVWVTHQAETPTEPGSGLAAEGARLFRLKKCGDCHAVSAAESQSKTGPSLTHVAGRKLLGGDIPVNPENLARWTNVPQSIKPGNRMPDQHLTAPEVQALTAYLETRQ